MKTKKCIYCGALIKDTQIICGKCKCVIKSTKNGGNARISRQEVATKHIAKKPGILKIIFGI